MVFKAICAVPTAKDFADIHLSKLQRKTPTVIHKRQPITVIRRFYIRKILTFKSFVCEKLETILDEFPKLKEIHPFYHYLFHVLYNEDRYKIALNNINLLKRFTERLADEIVRVMKHADSLYRCKTLKIDVLGRVVKRIKKIDSSLKYLEEVRLHMSRLPSIDPEKTTILLCGYPNVGKSSFINKITEANVEVEPYAFTTKSLYVGHLEYGYHKFQIIDTPGLLDRNLPEKNTVEMISITALAHLNACIVFMLDPSLSCGYSLQNQIKLFYSIAPTFKNNPVVIAANKCDLASFASLDDEDKAALEELRAHATTKEIIEMSTKTDYNLMAVRDKACELMLQKRECDLKKRIDAGEIVSNGLMTHIIFPDNYTPPENVCKSIPTEKSLIKKTNERELELEQGEDYFEDLRKHWQLENPEEKYDIIPEIYMGMNVQDYLDVNINEKLTALEAEEAELEKMGLYDADEPETLEQSEIRKTASKIRHVQALRRLESRVKNTTKPKLRRKSVDANAIVDGMEGLGVAIDKNKATHLMNSYRRSLSRSQSRGRLVKVDRSSSRPARSRSGFRDEKSAEKAESIGHKAQKKFIGKSGEADRRIPTLKPKHLFSGKRGIGKTSRR